MKKYDPNREEKLSQIKEGMFALAKKIVPCRTPSRKTKGIRLLSLFLLSLVGISLFNMRVYHRSYLEWLMQRRKSGYRTILFSEEENDEERGSVFSDKNNPYGDCMYWRDISFLIVVAMFLVIVFSRDALCWYILGLAASLCLWFYRFNIVI